MSPGVATGFDRQICRRAGDGRIGFREARLGWRTRAAGDRKAQLVSALITTARTGCSSSIGAAKGYANGNHDLDIPLNLLLCLDAMLCSYSLRVAGNDVGNTKVKLTLRANATAESWRTSLAVALPQPEIGR